MAAITEWISPEAGCEYCPQRREPRRRQQVPKIVARKMLEMTRHINTAWEAHVGRTGVTCYTCHRGNAVPANVWYKNPGPPEARGMARTETGQNHPATVAGLASLPYDPFTTSTAIRPASACSPRRRCLRARASRSSRPRRPTR